MATINSQVLQVLSAILSWAECNAIVWLTDWQCPLNKATDTAKVHPFFDVQV